MRNLFTALGFFAAFQVCAAHAAGPAVKCQTGKLKEAAKYGQCLVGAESKAIKKGQAADFSKCNTKFSTKWQKLESDWEGFCPSVGDVVTVGSHVTEHIFELAELFSGETSVACAFPATGQTVSFGAGDDGAVQAGAPLSYVDNGNGSITDMNTGLIWEKKVSPHIGFAPQCNDESGSCADPHSARNTYRWTNDAPLFNGTVVTIFLEQLNNRCHANPAVPCSSSTDCIPANEFDNRCGFLGHRDWRLPNLREILSIADYGREPAVHPVFHAATCADACTDITNPACSCTIDGYYWSSTTAAGATTDAWSVHFGYGGAISFGKHVFARARAVRGGL